MLKPKRPDGVQPIKLALRSIPDELRESASTVQEDVDGESAHTEKHAEKDKKREIVISQAQSTPTE